NAQPALIARTMLQMGDWYSIFDRPHESREMYAKARDFALANAAGEAEQDLLLNPPLPVQLPTFFSPPHKLKALSEGNPEPETAGQLDVRFEVNNYGKATDIEVRDVAATNNRRIEGRLRRILRLAEFRPRAPVADKASSRPYHLLYSFAQY